MDDCEDIPGYKRLCGQALQMYRALAAKGQARQPQQTVVMTPSPRALPMADACHWEGPIVGRCQSCNGNTTLAETRHRRECRYPTHQGTCSRKYVGPDLRSCDDCGEHNAPHPMCVGCPDLYQQGEKPLCGRDLFDIDPGRTSEASAAETYSRRIAGQAPACDRWGDSPVPSLPAGSWIALEQAGHDSRTLASMMPPDLDAVVGVARGGLFPAAIVAETTRAALYSVCGSTGQVSHCGHGGRSSSHQARRVVVIDDTSYGGSAMARAVPAVQRQFPEAVVESAVLYSTPRTHNRLAYVARLAPGHMVEWNLLGNPGLCGMIGVDWDGILNRDCVAGEDDDGPRYARFLDTVRPLQVPRSTPLAAIVTGRLAKYRPQCETWLARHRINYRQLVMWPGTDPSARWQNDACAYWKADVIRGLAGVRVYVESDPHQARVIADHSGKWVVCPPLGRTLLPQSTR